MRLLLPILLFTLPALASPPDKPLVELKASPSVKLMFPKAPKLEPQPVAPQPAPSRGTITKEIRYYIDSPVSLTVFSRPPGYFTSVPKKGPLTVVSKFVDQPTEFTEKEFKGPFVYWLDPKLSGTCEIIAVPGTVATEKDVFRQMVDVDDGTGPRPPPIPPKPKPDDPLPVAKTFRVIFVNESGKTLTAAENSVIYGKLVEDYLRANTTKEDGLPGFRRYDQNTDASNDQPTMAALWAAVKPKVTSVPCVVVEADGTAKILPLPATPAACIELFKQNGGK